MVKNRILAFLLLTGVAGTAQGELGPVVDGQVFDSNLQIWWLEDANLAGSLCLADPEGVWASFTPVNLTKEQICNGSGLMERRDGQPFIDHLNDVEYLGISNWRLPKTQNMDPSCSVQSGQQSFGFGCTGSEMGNLHYVSLGNSGEGCTPDCLVNTGPFQNMQAAEEYLSGTPTPLSNYGFNFGTGGQSEISSGFRTVWVWPVHEIQPIFSDGFEAAPKLVFATSSLYNGDLKTAGSGATGLEGADNLCNQHAQDAGLPGTYTAWISDRPLNARERISQGNGPYYLPDESGNFAEKVADYLDDILNCDPTCLNSFINRNEDGESVGNNAWTGTRENGNSFGFSSDTACQGWTDGVGDGSGVNGSAAVGRGRFGRLDRINGAWTSNAFFGCQNELRLYCFQD